MPENAAEGLCPQCLIQAAILVDPPDAETEQAETGKGWDSFLSVPPALESFGDYSDLRPIARGGMGVVYEARQASLNRRVALKMIASGSLARDEEVRRFKAEAEAAANLDHPNIVPIYEVGDKNGQPYFSMKLIDGGNLAQHMPRYRQDVPSAVALLATIARAVQYAHERGVLHRDLKPANILIDHSGNPHITDFGLAKITGRETNFTLSGALIGTPAYMPPEQASGDLKKLSTAADVYSLGAILYEMLTGHPPFRGQTVLETIQQVVGTQPRRPSLLNSKIDSDLETICLKCLEKDPRHRYHSAELLAADLDSWLRHEPILARPSSTVEIIVKWTRRHPLAAALVATIVCAIAAIAIVSTVLGLRVTAAAEKNRQQLVSLNLSTGNRLLLEGDSASALTHFVEALRLDQHRPARAEADRRRIASTLRQMPELEQLWFHDGSANSVTFSPDDQLIASAGGDRTARLWDVRTGALVGAPLVHEAPVSRAFFSPDGQRLATTSADNTACIWDVSSHRRLAGPFPENEFKFKRLTSSVTFSPDSRLVIAAHGSVARIRDAATGEIIGSALPHSAQINHVTFSPDGRRLLLVGANAEARLWNAEDFQPAFSFWKLPPQQNEWSGGWFNADGTRVLIAAHNASARIWSTVTGEPVTPVLTEAFAHAFVDAGFTTRSSRAATGKPPSADSPFVIDLDGTARLWLADSGRSYDLPRALAPEMRNSGFANGTTIIVPTLGDVIHVRNMGDGEPVGLVLHHGGFIFSAALNRDGSRAVSSDQNGVIRLWRRKQTNALREIENGAPIVAAEFAPDGKRFFTATSSGKLLLMDCLSTNSILQTFSAEILHAKISGSGDLIAAALNDHTARLWNAAKGREVIPPLQHEAPVRRVAFSPDGTRLLTITLSDQAQRSVARVWNTRTGALVAGPISHPTWLDWCEFSPDGSKFLTACADGYVRVFTSDTGKSIAAPMRCGGFVWEAHFSPDGTRIVAANTDYTYDARSALVFDAATGRLLTELAGHRDGVTQALFSPDGQEIATASEDLTMRLWNSRSGHPLAQPSIHAGKITRVAFSRNGRFVATASWDATARVWDALSGEPITPPLRHDRVVRAIDFAPDGNTLLTGGDDGVVRLWDISATTNSFADLTHLAELITAHRLEPDGSLTPLDPSSQRALWTKRHPVKP